MHTQDEQSINSVCVSDDQGKGKDSLKIVSHVELSGLRWTWYWWKHWSNSHISQLHAPSILQLKEVNAGADWHALAPIRHTLAPNSCSCVYSGAIWSMSSLIWACWARSFSASDRLVGESSLATAVWVADSQLWKWSRFWRKCCSSDASPSRSSRDLSCKEKLV